MNHETHCHGLGNARTSRLCKPLRALLRESSPQSMLDYFIQYMEAKGALHLLQFWFAVETFKNATSHYASPNHVKHHGPLLLHTPKMDNKQCINTESMESGVNMYSHITTTEEKQDHTELIGPITSNVTTVGIPALMTNTANQADKSVGLLGESNSEQYHVVTQGREIMSIHSSASIKGQEGVAAGEAIPDGMRTHQQQQLLKQLSLNVSVDALSIYTTYIALNALSRVSIPDDIRQEIEVNICPEDGKVNRSCFDKAQTFVYSSLEERFYPSFLSSHELCKYQYECISSGELCLLDYLLSDNALFYFMEYMEQENATSLVQFWVTAENYRSQLSDPMHVADIERDTTDAIAIYERYFSLQASSPLHFGDTIRMDIENRICDEHGPRIDSYDTAQKQAYDIMNEFHFPGFLKSSVYLRFLNELVVTINRPATTSTIPGHCEESVPLAQEDSPLQSNFTQSLDDPDSLWKRLPTILRLGYVDEFGQYISEIGQIPNKSARQKGDSSKKFGWLGKSRTEEETAMKIARTIVKEVLNTVSRTDKSPCR